MAETYNTIRSYEISIWTLQDRFLSVLKWANMSQKGQLQDPEMTLRDDGTEELTFKIPKFYWSGPDKIPNPMWLQVKKEPIEANMHKLKVIFNKNDENERVFEFLVVSVDSGHANDEVDISIKAEGLAFHELGKVGYKIALSQTNYELDLQKWIDDGMKGSKPEETIQYWNDKLFIDSQGNWRTNWTYEVQMDWSSYSNNDNKDESKDPHKVYEDEYVSSWQLDNDTKLVPRYVEGAKEKWRPIEVSNSNLYNITQQIAEQFGVFCRYQYDYDENYQIIGRRVIYYNNYIKDKEGHIDLTYPYSSTSITRTVDNSQVTTKLYVQNVDNDTMGTISIMEVDANKSKEDYLLCFDYMRDVDGVNADQYAEIEKYEAQMHQYNANLIKIQERIRVLSDQLVELEAKAKVQENSIVEDQDRYNEAHAGYLSLTNGEEKVKYDTARIVMEDKKYGKYININVSGVTPDSVHLYKDSNYTAMKNESQYSNPIGIFTRDLDETRQYVIRLRNIQYAGLAEGDSIYLSAYREPKNYYTQLQDLWSNRIKADQSNLNSTNEIIELYNWYLTGSRVGYGQAGFARADGAYEGLAITAPFDDPEILKNLADTRPYISWQVNHMRAGTTTDTDWDVDAFADFDISTTSADLYYYNEYYLRLKSLLSDKFERMMGPALREGYWQPEDYHDYGDMYEAQFNLSAQAEDIKDKSSLDNFIEGSQVQTIKIDEHLAPHMQVIWDCNKYYDNETPLIYESSISGRKDQHLIIDLSKHMNFVQEHLKDLCFFYSDPSCVSTIYDILENKLPSIITSLKYFHTKENESSYYDKLNGLIMNLNTEDHGEQSSKISQYFEKVGEIKASFNDFKNHSDDDNSNSNSNIPYYIKESLLSKDSESLLSEDFAISVSKLQEIISSLEAISTELYKLHDLYEATLTSSTSEQATFTKTEMTKIDKICEYLIYINSAVMSGEKALSNDDEDKGLLSIMRQYLVYLQWVESLEKNRFQSYQINSGCELGWLIDTNPIFGDNKKITDYGDRKRIPILIIKDADTVDDNTIRYLVEGKYIVYEGESLEQQTTWKGPVATKYRPFLGYYTTVEHTDETTNMTYTEMIINRGAEIASEEYIGADIGIEENKKQNTKFFTRDLVSHLYNTERQPKIEEYRYRRVYPRIFFNTLKLKSDSSDIHLSINDHLLENFEDYSIVSDDRSQGRKTQGIGYYLTIKPHVLFKYGNNNNTFKIIYTVSNADISIYLDALKVLRENAYPKVSYNVDVSILNPKFIATAYDRLNQIVHINDIDLQLEDANGYISAITMNLDHPWEDSVEIKNYETKFEDLFTTIVAQTEAMQRSQQGLNSVLQAFSRTTGLLDKDVLERSLVSANLKLKFDTAGRVTSDENGIMAISEDEKSAIAFRPGGIFTAYEHDADGEWIWNTGILPTGISANFISGGQLDINKIKLYAGNQVRFQMNSDGLFAYKSFASSHAKKDSKLSQDIAEEDMAVEKTDFKQYVVFNSEGLFLTAKQGAQYNTGKISIDDNQMKYLYGITKKDINRVEISWDGLKLRNWAGDEVFYADPDTGNLTLSGTVRANGGNIAGWEIQGNVLAGQHINLISHTSDENNNIAGIVLTSKPKLQETIMDKYTGKIYFVCTCTINGEEKTVYYPDPIIGSLEVKLNQVYHEDSVVVYVEPKYIKIVTFETAIDEPEATLDPTTGDAVTTVTANATTTKLYIMADEGLTQHVQVDGEYLEYDGDNTLTASWYSRMNNQSSLIKTTSVLTFVPYQEEDDVLVTLTPKSEEGQKVTFQVKADSGETTILRGNIGSFTINDNAGTFTQGTIANSTISQDNKINNIEMGNLIYDISVDDNTGIVSLKRVNGNPVNFNIATFKAYHDMLSRVAQVTITFSVSSDG